MFLQVHSSSNGNSSSNGSSNNNSSSGNTVLVDGLVVQPAYRSTPWEAEQQKAQQPKDKVWCFMLNYAVGSTTVIRLVRPPSQCVVRSLLLSSCAACGVAFPAAGISGAPGKRGSLPSSA
jgi:hypothetical protein